MESYYQMRRGQKPLTESIMRKLRDYNKVNQKRLQESYAKKVRKQKLQEKLISALRPLVKEAVRKMINK